MSKREPSAPLASPLSVDEVEALLSKQAAESQERRRLLRESEQEPAPLASPLSERDEAYGYLSRLFLHYAPQCQPLPTLPGLCTQIDNLIVGLAEKADKGNPQPSALASPREGLTALERIELVLPGLEGLVQNTVMGPIYVAHIREAAQSLEAATLREQQLREMAADWMRRHLLSDAPWPDFETCANELSALLGDRRG